LRFTASTAEASVAQSDVIFIAVPTPVAIWTDRLTSVSLKKLAREIAIAMTTYKSLLIKARVSGQKPATRLFGHDFKPLFQGARSISMWVSQS